MHNCYRAPPVQSVGFYSCSDFVVGYDMLSFSAISCMLFCFMVFLIPDRVRHTAAIPWIRDITRLLRERFVIDSFAFWLPLLSPVQKFDC